MDYQPWMNFYLSGEWTYDAMDEIAIKGNRGYLMVIVNWINGVLGSKIILRSGVFQWC